MVDDDVALRKLVRLLLRGDGHDVDEAGSAEEARELVRAHPPDLLVLDVGLPGADGRDLCGELKRRPETRAIPIIMLTAAFTTPDDMARGLAAGADEYMVKPFLRDVLRANVKRVLEKAQAAERAG